MGLLGCLITGLCTLEGLLLGIHVVVETLHLNGQLLFALFDHTKPALNTGIAASFFRGSLTDQGAVVADGLFRILLQVHLIDQRQINLRDRG